MIYYTGKDELVKMLKSRILDKWGNPFIMGALKGGSMLPTMTKETHLLRVSDLAAEKGWTADDLASKAEIARNTAQSYMRDYPEYLSRTVLLKIAEALEVPVSELFINERSET